MYVLSYSKRVSLKRERGLIVRIDSSEKKIGQRLVTKGYMSEKSVKVVLMRQEYGDSRLFGQIATSLNLLSTENLSECLKS